jgi:type VI secretion system protein ImpE
MSPTPQDLLAAGDPVGALKSLQQQVRGNAADAKQRVFLSQLLCVLGQWKRALDQLKVCGELDAGTLAMVNTYTAAVQCEQLREAVFAGKVMPHVFGPPAAWVAQLAQALQLEGQGQAAAAAALREQAFDEAPASSGTATIGDGEPQPFSWLADADSRLGPVLEIIINGRYGWLPLVNCAELIVEPVEDLRDLVWAPAQLTFANDAATVALLPVRYAGTPLDGVGDNGALALSRRTEGLELGAGQYRGLGQRTLTTDTAEFGLLELRQLSFTTPR